MKRSFPGRAGVLRMCLAWLVCGRALAEAGEPPRKLDRIEQVTRQLAQIDVTVTGPRETASRLLANDFVLTVGGKTISEFTLDAACPASAPGAASAPPPAARPATYLFYFDQTQMTAQGRMRAIALSRELLPALVTGESRASIVSNGRGLLTYSAPTGDLAALRAALERMEKEGPGLDPSAIDEAGRVAEIERLVREETADVAWQFHDLRAYAANAPGGQANRDALASSVEEIRGDTSGAKNAVLAQVRDFQREEQARARTSFERFALALRQLADAPPPKVVLFFADTLRINAGAHYYRVLETSPEGKSLGRTAPAGGTPSDGFEDPESRSALQGGASFSGVGSFLDGLVIAAAAHGARFYPIEAEGFAPSAARVADAQRSLRTLAKETGGRAFLNGMPSAQIAAAVREDLSCMYLLSFDPAGLPTDRPLPVFVALSKNDLTLQARGRIGIPSKEARLRSDKLAALYGTGEQRALLPMRSALIPMGFENRRFSALAQVAVLDTPKGDAVWDLGAWLVTGGELGEEISGKVRANGQGGAVVLERFVEIEPGPHTLVAVGQEPASELTVRDVQPGVWPDPRAGRAIVAPTVILQPAAGSFDRDGALRNAGSLVVSSGTPVQAALPLALVGLVCRGAQETQALRVERRLEGERVVAFPPIELVKEEGACAQIRDLIPGGTLSEGLFRYEISVKGGDSLLTRSVLEFAAASRTP